MISPQARVAAKRPGDPTPSDPHPAGSHRAVAFSGVFTDDGRRYPGNAMHKTKA
jgi:hypothetical protein